MFEKLGYEVCPSFDKERDDIIQSVKFGNEDALIAFCQGIQKGSPIDSYVTPQPSDMPGYDCRVIMAAGAFTQGATTELSADAPVKPPYIGYMQGSLVFDSGRAGVLVAADNIIRLRKGN
jgi:cystathionine beta-lyase family protein involved in aluminum resistance